MPIPVFTIDGVLPPYVGPTGPGGAPSDMTPYVVSPLEVITTLGQTTIRQVILRKWFQHRAALRALGVAEGFQWLDGSFCEDKVPGDLDIVTLFYRPAGAVTNVAAELLRLNNPTVFRRLQVKETYNLDAFFVDLNSHPTSMINYTRYLLGLFSHRRDDEIWKGMLQVDLLDAQGDAEGLAELDRLEAAASDVDATEDASLAGEVERQAGIPASSRFRTYGIPSSIEQRAA